MKGSFIFSLQLTLMDVSILWKAMVAVPARVRCLLMMTMMAFMMKTGQMT